MRVLWFSNTASSAADYLNSRSIGGSWIESLEAALSNTSGIELAVSFNVYDKDAKPFKINDTLYYPVNIKTPRSKFKKLKSYWTKSIESENNIPRYLGIIKEYKPDIIHVFGTEGAFGLVASKTDIPCVFHIQGNLTMCTQKWYSGITAFDTLRYSGKWELLKGTGFYHNYFLSKKKALRERNIFKQCNYFMGRTDWDRRITSVLSPHSKYFHCDEMMRPDFFSHQWSTQRKNTNYTIVTTIRNNIYKGLETILESKRILDEIDSASKVIWKIAGIDDTDEISQILKRKYRLTFEENGIRLLGKLQKSDLINELMASDLFVHPSHIDNSPNSICEAMLLGMPVIATYAGGIPSIVENKKEGLLVQDGDPYSLSGAILEMIGNTTMANELGVNARKRARSRHNPDKIVHDLINIYSAIISN